MGFDKVKAIRAAEKYLAQGKIPAAIQEYRRIVEHDEEDYTALNTLGDLCSRINEKQEAVTCYRRVADHYRDQGFALKAVAMYKKVSRINPHDHDTALSLATLYEQQGLMADARAQYLLAADAFTRAGHAREALEVLRRIADLDPSDTTIRLRLAQGYAADDFPEEAAEAYTQAGERLATRGEVEQALDAFTKALALRPTMHSALHGLVAAHSVLGTADEAADVLEQAIRSKPGDLELRALLARAYVEAEDAARAEEATAELVRLDPPSFTLFFDVARLYLQQGNVEAATRTLGAVAEQALKGRQEEPLLELLQETLARDPEQMQALHLLVRVHTWQRDDERLRTALERLADAAETTGAVEEERKALSQLTRLSPDETRYTERLKALGGPLFDDASETGGASDEVPTFESFMLNDDAFAAPPPAQATAPPPAEFEWNSVAPPAEVPDASASFADLNTFTDAGANAPPSQPEAFHEIDFGGDPTAPEGSEAQGGARFEQMLAQELESVDFYLEQGYTDIAAETLEMLERQYGQHAEIDRRRALIPAEASNAAASTTGDVPVYVSPETFDASDFASGIPETPAPSSEASDFAAFDFGGDALTTPAGADDNGPAPTFTFEEQANAEAPASPKPPKPSDAGAQPSPAAAGIDPGLAAIFDEFREAVEDSEEPASADYETHFNMGIAYREMGMLDQSIQELQTAIEQTAPGDGTTRYLQCCNLLGHCFMEKGMPRPAATWFGKGLSAPGHTEDEYQALRFELGTAYERMGDTRRAIEVFSEVYGVDVSYRGVADKLRDLQESKTVTSD
ncbi:MAG TPA: tetratricopeptide repeat protein, partial [Pyrinomonadaceae bacterium]|nr:tetratricopeptide repeat protein [Pyrinomonadaceae bacterium]